MRNAVASLPSHVVNGFMERAIAAGINPDRVLLLEGSTDDIRADLEGRKVVSLRTRNAGKVSMHAANFAARRKGMAPGQSGTARLEENYFYSSRRFPSLTTNTIGGGLLTAGSFPLFNKGMGEDGSGLGFPTGFILGQTETNLEVGGYLPQGANFVGSQLGVSFNTDIPTADLAQFMDAAALNFSKSGGQFGLSQGPLKFWPGGTGISGYAAAAVGGVPLAQTAAHNGAADIRAVRSLRIPRILREKEVFSYSIFVTRTTRATDGVAIALTTFIVATIWLFGGQKNAIPT